jgi:hypothetical protein
VKTLAAKPRKAYAIVMSNGVIDEIALRRKDLYPLPGERVTPVLIVPKP